jgi:hypothetical protein
MESLRNPDGKAKSHWNLPFKRSVGDGRVKPASLNSTTAVGRRVPVRTAAPSGKGPPSEPEPSSVWSLNLQVESEIHRSYSDGNLHALGAAPGRVDAKRGCLAGHLVNEQP